MIDEAEAVAHRRFMVLNLVRLISLGCVLFGIAASQGAVDFPRMPGIALAIIGLFGFFFGPNLLARRWRSDDQ